MKITKSQLSFITREIKKVDWEQPGLDENKAWSDIYTASKNSKEFKGWSLPKAQIRYLGDILIALEFSTSETIKTLTDINYSKEIESFAPPEPKSKSSTKTKDNEVKNKDAKSRTKSESPTKEKKATMNSQELSLEERIIDYRIIKMALTEGLEQEVKKAMKNGWVPYGGIGVNRPGVGGMALGQMTYFQIMVKLKPSNK